MSNGRFGIHGGQYIPETLMNEIIHLEQEYNHYKEDPAFIAELEPCFGNTPTARRFCIMRKR